LRIDDFDSPRFAFRQRVKSGADVGMKPAGFQVEPVLATGLSAPPSESDSDGDIEQQCKVRGEPACRPLVHRAQLL
jgi:hypothetical protein